MKEKRSFLVHIKTLICVKCVCDSDKKCKGTSEQSGHPPRCSERPVRQSAVEFCGCKSDLHGQTAEGAHVHFGMFRNILCLKRK